MHWTMEVPFPAVPSSWSFAWARCRGWVGKCFKGWLWLHVFCFRKRPKSGLEMLPNSPAAEVD